MMRCRLGRWTVPSLLFTLLLSVYLLTYSGFITSADELSMLSVTENFVERGKFETDQLAWAVWEHGWAAQGTIGLDGHVYSKKGPGMSILLGPLFELAHLSPRLGNVHTVFLLNPLITALAAVVLFGLSRRLGYGDSVSFTLGLLAGLATIAWPYSKTLFQEPLTGLFFIAAVYFTVGTLNARNFFAAAVTLGLAISLRMTSVPVVALVIAYAGYRLHKAYGLRRCRSSLYLLLLLTAIPVSVLGAILYYNWVRFGVGGLFNAGYSGHATFSTPLLEGLAGLLFSPDESLLVFSPVLIFSLVGLPLMWRRHKAEASLLGSVILANLLLFAKWYDWRGGLAWGPRFMVPLTPIFLSMMLPWLNERVFGGGGWRRWVFVVAVLASVILQCVASLVPFSALLAEGRWPISAAFLAFNPAHFDTAWMRPGFPVDWGVVALFGGIALGSLSLGILALRRPGSILLVGSIGLLLTTLFAGVWLVGRTYVDYRLHGGDDLRALCVFLAQHADQRDVVILDNHVYTEFFLNYDRSSAPRYGFLRDDALRPEARLTLESLLLSVEDIWLISDRPDYSPLPKPEETWLNEHAFRTSEDAFSDYARLIRYHQPAPGVMRTYHAAIEFDNGAKLVEYQTTEKDGWMPGDVSNLVLVWGTEVAPLSDFNVSVQIWGSDGTLRWQYDSAPIKGLRPSSSWQPGEELIDRYGIPLPDDPDEYRIAVVLYDAGTGQRAKVVTPRESAGQDFAVLNSLLVRVAE